VRFFAPGEMRAAAMVERVHKEYWDLSWQSEAQLPDTFEPEVKGVRGVFRRQFHAFFVEHLAPIAPPGASLIEIGCGRSQLLPYFAKRFGLRVSGLDYSTVGCDKARRILARDGIAGEILCADLWDPRSVTTPGYDVVFSFGLVEHFEDTPRVIEAMARFARPGGTLLTLIPNMRGTVGAIQRILSRDIYDIHVPLSAAALARAHTDAGLALRAGGYLLPAHFAVCNPGNRSGTWVAFALRQLAYRGAIAFSTTLLWIHERVARLPAGELMSPYAFVLATKPTHEPPRDLSSAERFRAH
jgi:SAM-dependent methyltransferase